MSDQPTNPLPPPRSRPKPQDSPYLFTIVLAALGVWFFYDGFFNPDMEEHATFNRIGAGVLLGWAAWDFHRMRQRLRKRPEEAARTAAEDPGATES